MDEWYEELDFEDNPFSVDPSDYIKNIVGREDIIEELDYRVRSGSIVFLEGPRGSGRTSMLRAIINRFRGRGRVIYVNAEKFEKKLDIEDLLVQRNGLVKGMLLKKKPKRMILLMDNVEELSHRNTERLKHYFDENYLQAVVFTGESFEKAGFSESLKLRIEGRVISIPQMTDQQVVQMVRSRIGDSKLVSDEVVLELGARYKNNPKQILKALDEVAEFVVSLDEEVITSKHVDEVLGAAKSSKAKKKSEKKNPEPAVEEEPKEADVTEAEEMVEVLEEYDDTSTEEESAEEAEKKEAKTAADEGELATGEKPAVDNDLDDIDAFFDEVEEEKPVEAEPKAEPTTEPAESDVVPDEEEPSKDKQADLDKHVMVEEEDVADKDEKKESDDNFFDDEFFLDEENEKKEDYSEDDDIFDEFFDDEEEK